MAVEGFEALPVAQVTFHGAEGYCSYMSKFFCSDSAWTDACRGSWDNDYSYGNEYDSNACNGGDAFDALVLRSRCGPWLLDSAAKLPACIVNANPSAGRRAGVVGVTHECPGVFNAALAECVRTLLAGRQPDPLGVELPVKIVES